MKPRTAPTTMNTVPSGRLDVRMKGAPAVGGTEGATMTNAPDRVGSPLGSAPPSVAELPPVMTGTEPVVAPDDPEPVMTTVGEGPVDVAPVDFTLLEFVVFPSAEVGPVDVAAAADVCFVADCVSSVVAAVSADLAAAWEDKAFERLGSAVSAAVDIAKREIAAAESNGNREKRMMGIYNDCIRALRIE